MVRLLALLLLLGTWQASGIGAQEALEIPSVTIAGGGLPQAVELAPADADAFRRRVNQLPRLEDPPSVSGPQYAVTTSYWAFALRLEEDEDPLDVAVRGDYYPDGGYVRVTLETAQDGDLDVWMVLSLRQRAILDRYIRLADEGLIGEAPSTIDVLAASTHEVFGVQAGNSIVPPETAAALLEGLASANPGPLLETQEPPVAGADGFWLIVTLLEGRTHRYYATGAALTEGLGTERYDASSVQDLLASIAPDSRMEIVQESPAGSWLWWPAAIGGALGAIGLAVWLRRRAAVS